ncbi:MAG: cold-shock protein [Mesorhizobium sp.]|nr:MAG: cold-shock protein [Mesorhizobium sp.]
MGFVAVLIDVNHATLQNRENIGCPDVFVHISAVERSGLSTLADGQKVNYEIEQDRRTGKSSAGNLSKVK